MQLSKSFKKEKTQEENAKEMTSTSVKAYY